MMIIQSQDLDNLPGPCAGHTETVKYIYSYLKKVDDQEHNEAKGAIIPAKQNVREIKKIQQSVLKPEFQPPY